MKLIKINAPVELNSGIEIVPGAIVVISEGYAAIANEKDGFIPCQISTRVFSSMEAFTSNKNSIIDIKSFPTAHGNLLLTVTDFQTLPTEQLLVNAVKNRLEIVFPESLEIIDYTPVVVEPEVVEPEITEPTEPTEPTQPTEPEVTEPETETQP